jgi:predicted component of type VI protein secretion system
MAYVIFTANGDEVDRRELTAAVTIGRAQDADIPVRDILLSRNHCRLEPSGENWIVTDLGSKNGTYLGYRQITRHQLKDGDELRLGRTHMTFKAGAFEPAPAGTRRRDIVRPADPTEALAGTVAGFLLVEPGEVEREAGAPVPQPRPPEPSAYASEDVYSMLNEIASSSWDSIQAQASRPLVMERPLPRPSGYREAPTVAAARRPRVAFCLQAPSGDPNAAIVAPASESKPSRKSKGPESPSLPPGSHRAPRWWNVPARTRRNIAVGIVSLVATALLVGAWIVAVNHGPRTSMAGPASKSRDVADITFPSPAVEHVPAALATPLAKPAAVALPMVKPSIPNDRAALGAAARVALVQILVVR